MISSEVDRKEIIPRPLAKGRLSSVIEQEIGFGACKRVKRHQIRFSRRGYSPELKSAEQRRARCFVVSRPRVVQTEHVPHVPEVKCSCHRLRCGSLLQIPTEANPITASNGKVDGRSACADLLSCKVACIWMLFD